MKQDVPQNPRQAPTPSPDGGAFISLTDASERTKKFREEYVYHAYDKEEKIKAHYFSKKQVEDLLRQEGCRGIRVYHAVQADIDKDENGKPIDRREVLLVATDEDGNDILKKSPKSGCSPLSIFMAVPASKEQEEDALILGNPSPCPDLCGTPNSLNGNPK